MVKKFLSNDNLFYSQFIHFPSFTVVFDPTKVIRYPGFNCEDRRLQDPEARHYRAPPWHIYMAAFEQHVADLNRRAAEGRRIRVGGEIASSEQKKANRKQIEEAPSNSRGFSVFLI